MLKSAVQPGLTNLSRMRCSPTDQPVERIHLQMRLIAQNNRPMCDGRLPTGPLRRTNNRAEHSSLGSRVLDDVLASKRQAVQFAANIRVAGSAHHHNLLRLELPP